MGGADFIHLLFSEFLNFDPDDPAWINRDRFFLDPGHMSPMLYSILHLTGHYSTEDLMQFRQWGSCTPGHPELDTGRGVENTSGPLGQGHVMAVGCAIAQRVLAARLGDWLDHRVFAFLSDGSIQEEISQGAGRIAGRLGLGNLIMFFDSNDIQLSTRVDEVTEEDTGKKYESWNWHVQTIDGNDEEAIRTAMASAIRETERPSLIIGKTRMGLGAVAGDGAPMEGLTSTHGQPLSKAGVSVEKTILHLGDIVMAVGIPAELGKNLFKPYFSTKTQGTGMGLALTEKLIGQHGGQVDFESGTQGTTFRITLPLEPPRDEL